ncbi:MAG: hypothetical protein L7S72_08640 [Flavobacteriales bacterium]|nr:hypothetical protein [Flavobacteriales bacterium]
MLDTLWGIQNPEVVERKISYEKLEEIHVLKHQLLKQEDVVRTEEFWDNTIYSINSILWKWTNTPNPFLYKDQTLEGHISNLQSQLKKAIEYEYNAKNHLEEIVNRIVSLRHSVDSPLFDSVTEHLDPKRNLCFLATTNSYDYLRKEVKSISKKWKVKTPNQLREDQIYDELIFFGQFNNLFYGKFSDSTLEFLFTSTRARKIYWVHYEWISSNWKPQIFLVGSNDVHKPFAGKKDIFTSDGKLSITDLDFVPKIDEKRYVDLINISINQDEDNSLAQTQDLEEAYCFLLTEKRDDKSLVAFISANGSKALAISDFDGDGTLDIWKFLPNELGKGMYLLRRTRGAGRDVLEVIADKHLGDDAAYLRGRQIKWKKSLSEVVKTTGLSQSVELLKNMGCTPANKSNLKRWMSDSSIRTSKPSHFYMLMEFAGLKDTASAMWNDMRRINAAHSTAGFELDALLKSKIEDINAGDLYGNTSYEFKLSEDENLGALTAFAIDERLESLVEVPTSWTHWGVREL